MKLSVAWIFWKIGIHEETPHYTRKQSRTPKRKKKDAASMLVAKMAGMSMGS
jgi:hypothetical protein